MKLGRLLAVIALAAAAAFPMIGMSAAPAGATPTSAIVGRAVIDSITPVAGAELRVLDAGAGSPSATIVAAADGTYRIDGLEPGVRVLEVRPPATFSWASAMNPARATYAVEVPAGGLAVFDPVLREGRLTGRVTTDATPGFPPQTLDIVATNAVGERFSGFIDSAPYSMPLPPGTYSITYRGTVPALGRTLAPVTVDGVVVDPVSATTVDVVLPASPPYTGPTFVGRVTDTLGTPVAGVRIVGTGDGVTDAEGRYGIDLGPEPTVNLDADFVPPLESGLAIVRAGRGPCALSPCVLDVVLPPAGSLTGRVTDGAGEPAAGSGLLIGSVSTGRRATTGPDGAYRFDQLPAGPVVVVSEFGTHPAEVVAGDTTTLDISPEPPVVVPESPMPWLLSLGAVTVAVAVARRRPVAARP